MIRMLSKIASSLTVASHGNKDIPKHRKTVVTHARRLIAAISDPVVLRSLRCFTCGLLREYTT